MISLTMITFFLLLILGVPVAFVVLCAAAVGVLSSGANPVILTQQLFLGCNSYVLLAVPFFIISGDIAAKGTTAQKLVNAINAFLGHLPGGLVIAAVFASAFFGAITGSSMACVVAIGALMLPKLDDNGYPRRLSLGLITAAGTLGVMIPPSIPMLQIAASMGVSVGKQFTAGFIPGIMTAAMMSVYIAAYAKKHRLPSQRRLPMRERVLVLKDSFWALLYPVIVLGTIYCGIATPTEAAIISLVYVIILEISQGLKAAREQGDARVLAVLFNSGKELWGYMKGSTVNAATLTITVATAQVFVWLLTTQKVPGMIYNMVIGNVTNVVLLWAGLCVLLFIAGCFTNVSVVVIILGPILVPVLQYFNIDFVHFGIVAIMMCQIGFLTPPFGLCLFVAMKIAKESMDNVIHSTMPYLFIMILAAVLLIAFPSISLFLPNLMFQ